MLFCRNVRYINFINNNNNVHNVNDFKFLGVTINECLAWSPHIDKIANKISKYVGLLNKLKHYLPASILKTLYCSLILPHLNYGSLAWGFDANRIFKLQKRALRCITNSKFNAHTEPLFKQLNLLKIDDIFFIELHEVLLQVLSLFIAFLLYFLEFFYSCRYTPLQY